MSALKARSVLYHPFSLTARALIKDRKLLTMEKYGSKLQINTIMFILLLKKQNTKTFKNLETIKYYHDCFSICDFFVISVQFRSCWWFL